MKNIILVIAILGFTAVSIAQTDEKSDTKKTDTKAESKPEVKPETKAEAKVEAKTETPKKEEVVEAAKPEAPVKQAVAAEDTRPNKSWNVHARIQAGSYESTGNASLAFANAGQYPTLTSGEKIAMNMKSVTSGFQFGGGYRHSQWLSIESHILLLAGQQDSKITTSTGATHDVKMETGFVYFSPATWTGYFTDWLYVQAGVGFVAEAHKVTTNISNIGTFETGSFGRGVNLGIGVEFPISKMFTLGGGFTVISATTVTQEKKLNEGQLSEVTAKWEERKIGIGMFNFGTKIYF